MDEKTYRARILEAFGRIEKGFEKIDPDLAECENAQGALTITLRNRSKVIVSPQPSVRQIWLAVAAEGKAYHFNFDGGSGRWLDDRGTGHELFAQISEAVGAELHQTIAI
ncbi:MAG: iron donor protein CyaY [Pseudomonadota bacterium]